MRTAKLGKVYDWLFVRGMGKVVGQLLLVIKRENFRELYILNIFMRPAKSTLPIANFH